MRFAAPESGVMRLPLPLALSLSIQLVREHVVAVHGVNVSRLAGIKYKYDAENFFRRNSNIPPTCVRNLNHSRGTAHVAISRKEKFRRGFSEGNRSSLTPCCLLIPSSGYVVGHPEVIHFIRHAEPPGA